MSIFTCSSIAQTGKRYLFGFHQYPQFRTMSGLPGSSFPVTQEGLVDSSGAIALSTPIAYSLASGKFVIGGMASSASGNFAAVAKRGDDYVKGNGSAQILGGFSVHGMGNITVATLILSGDLDNAMNIQWTPRQASDATITYAVGVQDIFGGGGASGTHIAGDRDTSQSVYGVATSKVSKKTYISAGYGTYRFSRPFGNVSTSLLENTNVYAEYDSFDWNFGVGYSMGLLRTAHRDIKMLMNFGFVRARYPSVSINFAF